ncbi:hypothetical protein DMC30DRAFT_406988 [Rhodotorula diobovata]|uniref:SRP9 domain-containing protein n=1 Tax=Rhodotorula diobovata TaxID=5288 RepID=A0A5C5FK35_9BASI|nr:hypothetical protein DMC30DRAFT_406988 [Rhodotorula diobovata]
MLYRDWDRFKDACGALCRDSDVPTRACIRWRHEAGLLVFKVTNDHKCLTYKTRSTTYLNRFDALNRAMLRHYQNQRRPASPLPDGVTTGGPLPPAAAANAASPVSARAAGEGGADETATTKAKKRRSKKKAK